MELTNEEAAKIISCMGWGYPEKKIEKASQMAVKALKERDEYREAHDLRIAMDVIPLEDEYPMFMCPKCGNIVEDEDHCWDEFYKCCPRCGQVLRWWPEVE